MAGFTMLGMPQALQGSIIVYNVKMDGPSESPANDSPGIGSGTVTIDTTLHTMAVNVIFSGLTGTTTASHIHAATAVAGIGTAGVETATPSFTGFPLGVTSGSFINTLDLTNATTYNPAYVTANGTVAGAGTALLTAMADGKSYYNIHTSTFGGGEIRGFLVAVPEPSSMILSGLAMIALAAGYRLTSRYFL